MEGKEQFQKEAGTHPQVSDIFGRVLIFIVASSDQMLFTWQRPKHQHGLTALRFRDVHELAPQTHWVYRAKHTDVVESIQKEMEGCGGESQRLRQSDSAGPQRQFEAYKNSLRA